MADNVASLELCKELHELSDWDDDSLDGKHWHREGEINSAGIIPLYNLGYLLRKLPRYLDQSTNELTVAKWGHDYWRACHMPINLGHYPELRSQAETPEDAVALYAIELFKQGILKKEETK